MLAGTGERVLLRAGAEPAASPVLGEVHRVVPRHLASIRTELGHLGRQVSGFALEHLLPERGFDRARALVGTEGSCAAVLEATAALVPAPAATALVVLGFPDMAAAADAVPAVPPHPPTACEGLDSRIVDVVRLRRGKAAVPELPKGSAWLLVELAGSTAAELLPRAREMIRDAAPLER